MLVIEDQQALSAEPRSQPGDLARQLARRYVSEVAVGVIKQGDGADPESGGLAEFSVPRLAQSGAVLVQRGRLALGESQHMPRGAARGEAARHQAGPKVSSSGWGTTASDCRQPGSSRSGGDTAPHPRSQEGQADPAPAPPLPLHRSARERYSRHLSEPGTGRRVGWSRSTGADARRASSLRPGVAQGREIDATRRSDPLAAASARDESPANRAGGP